MVIKTTKFGVYCITMKSSENSMRKFTGDGLLVNLDSNECLLEVTGDGCTIMLAHNYGSVRIVGDGCSLKVGQNTGDITYRGDGGRVVLGTECSRNKIKYVGCGGKISYNKNLTSCGTATAATSPELDNLLNERKEARRDSPGTRQRNRIVTVTKIITVKNDGRTVKRCFANSGSVIRSLNENG